MVRNQSDRMRKCMPGRLEGRAEHCKFHFNLRLLNLLAHQVTWWMVAMATTLDPPDTLHISELKWTVIISLNECWEKDRKRDMQELKSIRKTKDCENKGDQENDNGVACWMQKKKHKDTSGSFCQMNSTAVRSAVQMTSAVGWTHILHA